MAERREEYEYDVVLCWDNYVFVFECKSRSLSGHHPVQAYHFGLEMRSGAKQVKRLANALRDNPDILREKMQVNVANKIILPCVLNAMPFSRNGKVDSVYFTEFQPRMSGLCCRFLGLDTPCGFFEA
jgi:hypothetical protein